MNSAVKMLRNVADVQLGHPFRGSISDVPNAEFCVVRAKDINEYFQIDDTDLVRANITGRKKPEILEYGDILFLAKGRRNVACFVNESTERYVCGPEFFLVRVKPEYIDQLMPDYLSWQLNQIPAQKHFKQGSTGSNQVSINKQELECIKLVIPPIKKQILVVNMWNTYLREQQVLDQMSQNRRRQVLEINKQFLQKCIVKNGLIK